MYCGSVQDLDIQESSRPVGYIYCRSVQDLDIQESARPVGYIHCGSVLGLSMCNWPARTVNICCGLGLGLYIRILRTDGVPKKMQVTDVMSEFIVTIRGSRPTYCSCINGHSGTIPPAIYTRETNRNHVGFEFLTAVVIKSSIFWDITPCSPLKVTDISEEHVASIYMDKE
jgi:hypothetical protein